MRHCALCSSQPQSIANSMQPTQPTSRKWRSRIKDKFRSRKRPNINELTPVACPQRCDSDDSFVQTHEIENNQQHDNALDIELILASLAAFIALCCAFSFQTILQLMLVIQICCCRLPSRFCLWALFVLTLAPISTRLRLEVNACVAMLDCLAACDWGYAWMRVRDKVLDKVQSTTS